MPHVYRLADAQPDRPTVLAVGMFDGVHIGHQHLLNQLVDRAHATDRAPAVLTFHPHPDTVLGRAEGRYYLTTPEQRAALMAELGVAWVVTHPFNTTVRQMRAAAFVDRLLEHLNMSELWIGQNFALGYKREGNVDFLRAEGDRKGFSVEVVELLTSNSSSTVNSSRIRTALDAGDIDKVTHWLGRPYRLEGEVMHGDGRGRTIGFPTANIGVWDQKMLPARGVYAGWAHLNGETFMAVANIGSRPTFEGKLVTVEAHLLDFDRNIYGEHVIFDVVARLRPEMKFDGVEALIAQIRQDVVAGRELLSDLPRP